MGDTEELVDRISRFIRQQKEVYGEFSTDLPSNARKPDSVTKTVPVEKEAQAEATSLSKEINESAESESAPALTLEEKLKNCSSIEELRQLCEQSSALKTDLEGTNLVFGVGNPDADLMIVGEAPGENEDIQGEPFVGKAGQLLDKIMAAINFDRSDLYIANILKHRPPNNRNPLPEERKRSLPYLLKQIELVDPKIILCVGKVAATTLLNKDATLGSMRQKIHTFMNRELIVTYHPAALLRNPQWKRPTWEDVQLLQKRYEELGGKP